MCAHFDTSVWIDFFAGKPAVVSGVSSLIDADLIVTSRPWIRILSACTSWDSCGFTEGAEAPDPSWERLPSHQIPTNDAVNIRATADGAAILRKDGT